MRDNIHICTHRLNDERKKQHIAFGCLLSTLPFEAKLSESKCMTNHIKWLLYCKCLSNIAHQWFFSTFWSTQNCIQIRKLSVLLWMTRCLNEIKIVFIDRIFIITNVEFMRLTNYTHFEISFDFNSNNNSNKIICYEPMSG